MRLTVLTWNMDYWKRNTIQREASWKYLTRELSPDIALLQDFFPPASCDGSYNVLYREIGGTRKWGSAIASKALAIKEIEFRNGYPGSVLSAEATLPNDRILTVISLYGLIDENGYATTTLHRMLSDLTPLLNGKMGKREFIVGGDYNASTQIDEVYKGKYPSHQILFDRLEDFGLRNCVAKFNSGHVQTLRHHFSSVQWQNDYIHASSNIMNCLVSCRVVNDPVIHDMSDHNPVIAEFEL
jgi:exonuclease III